MNSSIAKKIEDYFDIDKKVSTETLEILTWYIYQLEENRHHDLHLIAKILPETYSSALVNYFDGDYIKMPTKEEYIRLRLLAVCFFLKESLGWSWDRIKIFLNIAGKEKEIEEFSSISLGNKINKIRKNLHNDIKSIMENCEIVNDYFIFKSYLENPFEKDTNER